MTILVIILFLIVFGYCVYYVINLLMRKRITEGFTPAQERFLTTNDSHHWLMSTLFPGKVDIANLKETNPHHSNYYYVDDKALPIETTNPNIVTHRPTLQERATCLAPNHPIRRVIKEYQPYMYDEAEIINYYDHPYYRDWRYPERPIDLEFANNPQKYCDKNPQVYPCYRYYSKW